MHNAFWLHIIGWIFTQYRGDLSRIDLNDFTCIIFNEVSGFNHIAITQTNALSWAEFLLKLLAVLFFKVVLINKDFFSEWYSTL